MGLFVCGEPLGIAACAILLRALLLAGRARAVPAACRGITPWLLRDAPLWVLVRVCRLLRTSAEDAMVELLRML